MSKVLSNRLTKANPKNSKFVKGDEVIVTAGNGRAVGQTGKIERIDVKRNRVYVSGYNLRKKHSRVDMQNQSGGIIDKLMPIHISNIALVDPKTKKPTKIGYRIEDGKKTRIARSSGTVLSS